MFMAFSPPVQLFLLSILWGGALGVLWDIFRILRLGFGKNKIIVIIEDIVYAILFAVFTLLFFYFFTSGYFRFFVIIGELLGFLLYYMTIGKIVYIVFKFLIKWIKKFLWLISWPFRKFFGGIIRITKKLYSNIHDRYVKIEEDEKIT